MAKFKKIDTIGKIRATGIVPVFYNKDVELTKKVVKACRSEEHTSELQSQR